MTDAVKVWYSIVAVLTVAFSVGPGPSQRRHRRESSMISCLTSEEPIAMVAARTAAADRLAENRYRLAWTDITPPAPVSDASVCARAADAYARAARSSQGGHTPARAGVVRAGGLYFVLSPPATAVGEFTGVGVLDGEFRWLVGLAM